MIKGTVERWHQFVTGESPEGLDQLLADDVAFYSPIVHTPQRGRDITTMYVQAAAQTLRGDGGEGGFRYTKQVVAGDVAMLEGDVAAAVAVGDPEGGFVDQPGLAEAEPWQPLPQRSR